MWDRAVCLCGARNWVNLGDLEDQTAPDVEAFRCFKCGEVTPIVDEIDLELTHGPEWRTGRRKEGR
jgi:hypothetical protein